MQIAPHRVSSGWRFRRTTDPRGRRCSIALYTAFSGTPATAWTSAGESSLFMDIEITLSWRDNITVLTTIFNPAARHVRNRVYHVGGTISAPAIKRLQALAMGTKPDYRSRIVTQGLDRTPHRAFLRATGLDDGDLD